MSWPNPQSLKLLDRLLSALPSYLQDAAQLRHEIHRYPDLSDSEISTAERILEYLPEDDPIALLDTGFAVRVGPGFGPTVALRAELDALPIQEETGAPWASLKPGVMHACGHDVHLAALWALIRAAHDVDDLPIPMLGLFQPAEEVQPSGAERIIQAGVLAEHEIAAIIAAHVQPRLALGQVSTGAGAVNAATEEFEITVNGAPGHGAYPHVAIDPIPVLAAIVQGLQEIVSRDLNPMHPAVITVGELHAGTAPNIISASGYMRGILRTLNPSDRNLIVERVRALVTHVAASRGASAEVRWLDDDPVLVNNDELAASADGLFDSIGVTPIDPAFRSMGADDFSHYLSLAPGLMMFVGSGTGMVSYTRGEIALHHPKFLPSDSLIGEVAKALAVGYVSGAHLAGAV
ncbi:MAG: amidohydrolase [Propionibacteriaceae bacterium]|nr:amidohydrolase [Propionibacteriaceae bacterium]